MSHKKIFITAIFASLAVVVFVGFSVATSGGTIGTISSNTAGARAATAEEIAEWFYEQQAEPPADFDWVYSFQVLPQKDYNIDNFPLDVPINFPELFGEPSTENRRLRRDIEEIFPILPIAEFDFVSRGQATISYNEILSDGTLADNFFSVLISTERPTTDEERTAVESFINNSVVGFHENEIFITVFFEE
ncbi:MAG: hypothetical protein FWG65_10740 [Turicibacter sp.]|nr:hypothetical protein [Turicibacter sp.]